MNSLEIVTPVKSSVVMVTATGTATAVFICHRTSATEVEIGASDGVAGQCIIFIT